jgi:hypothetical protein
MKACFFVSSFFIFMAAYAEETGNMEKKFIKGNLTDKTAAVRQAAEEESALLSTEAIDFVLKNSEKLGDDRDLAALAVAGIFAVPDVDSATETKLMTLFSGFHDATVQTAVLDKLYSLPDGSVSTTTIKTVNLWIAAAAASKDSENDVQKAAINLLGKVGNGDSFKYLFECYNQNIWPAEENVLRQSLENLSPKSLPEIIKLISSGSVDSVTAVSDLLLKNDKITDFFKAEIAENILSETIYIVKGNPDKTKDTIDLQMTALKILSTNKWTRATELIEKYFSLAQQEYKDKFLSEEQFATVIQYTSSFATGGIVKALVDYLGSLNNDASEGKFPADTIILTVIQSLEKLGDKSAFDNLLLVTYMDYPESVVAAARDALSRLKW